MQQTFSESLTVLQSLLQLPETQLWTEQTEFLPWWVYSAGSEAIIFK